METDSIGKNAKELQLPLSKYMKVVRH